MASATQLPGPMETSSSSNTGAPSVQKREAQFELGTTLALFLWPSLTLAVTNQWGGPDSASKREWFASTLLDLLRETPRADVDTEWVETFLLQVMLDEFEVNVDDGSAFDVAEEILRLRRECERGEFGSVEGLRVRYGDGQGRGVGGFKEGEEQGDTSGSDDEDGEGDVEMDEAPQLVRIRERVEPEVDDDGFTKVTKKKR